MSRVTQLPPALPEASPMSYTVLDLAQLALAVYDDPLPAVDGWTPRQSFGNTTKYGFYAGLYQGSRDTTNFVLA